ncbi:MAG: DUF5372 family protein, partial [Planctomycetota bacterium]
RWTRSSTAPAGDVERQRFRVTHPFHPLFGCEFELVVRRQNWGEDRVVFHDADGRLISLPARWTSVCVPDPFVVVAAGRAPFRVEDLLRLAELVRQQQKEQGT